MFLLGVLSCKLPSFYWDRLVPKTDVFSEQVLSGTAISAAKNIKKT